MKKIIGISTSKSEGRIANVLRVKDSYVKSIKKAGGVPVILPILESKEDMEALVKKVDGLLLSGGIDVSPITYGENPGKKCSLFQMERDRAELCYLKTAQEEGIPTLGICRGMQLANVFFGGTLYQDLEEDFGSSVIHCPSEAGDPDFMHFIDVEEGILRRAFGKDRFVVNSQHHQGIKKLGEGLRVTARSDDGLPEAVEALGDWYFHGVQFHPERLWQSPYLQKIIDDFVEQVGVRK